MAEKRPVVRVVAVVAGIAVLAGAGFGVASAVSGPSDPTANLRTATVSRGTVRQLLPLTGSVQRVSEVAASFPVSGTVTGVQVSVGQQVQQGQVLATLDQVPLQAALLEAQAQQAQARAQLDSDQNPTAASARSGASGTGTGSAAEAAGAGSGAGSGSAAGAGSASGSSSGAGAGSAGAAAQGSGRGSSATGQGSGASSGDHGASGQGSAGQGSAGQGSGATGSGSSGTTGQGGEKDSDLVGDEASGARGDHQGGSQGSSQAPDSKPLKDLDQTMQRVHQLVERQQQICRNLPGMTGPTTPMPTFSPVPTPSPTATGQPTADPSSTPTSSPGTSSPGPTSPGPTSPEPTSPEPTSTASPTAVPPSTPSAPPSAPASPTLSPTGQSPAGNHPGGQPGTGPSDNSADPAALQACSSTLVELAQAEQQAMAQISAAYASLGQASQSPSGQGNQGSSDSGTAGQPTHGNAAGAGTNAGSTGTERNGGSSTTGAGRTGSGAQPSAEPTVDEAKVAKDRVSVMQADQAVSTANSNLEGATLKAPIAGTVGAVGLAQGAQASTSSSVTIVGPGAVEVTLDVPLNNIPQLKLGQAARVNAPGTTTTDAGNVTEISPLPSSTSGTPTYQTKVLVPNPGPGLISGGRADVAVVVGEVADTLTVPVSAVTPVATGRGTVNLLDGTSTKVVSVSTGLVGGGLVQINEGLNAGQRVVLADVSAALPSNQSSRGLGGGGGPGGGGPPR